MKNFKSFYESQTAINEIIQSPHPYQTKASYFSGTKIFLWSYTEKYRYLLSKCLENAVLIRLEMVQCKCLLENL